MRSKRPVVAGVAALFGSLALSPSVVAQEQATDEHPIIGAWILPGGRHPA